MKAAFIWLVIGLALFFGFGLEASPLNRPIIVEIGSFAGVLCFVVAFMFAAMNPPGLDDRDWRDWR